MNSRNSLGMALVTALLAGCSMPGFAAPGRGLVPPPGFTAQVRQDPAEREAPECKAAPKPYTGKLAFPSKYEGSDSARDDLNPKAEAKYKEQTAPIREMEKSFSADVDRYIRTGHVKTMRCALDGLAAWAKADALTAVTGDHTGKSMRKWALASFASAYLRLKFSSSYPLDQAGDSPKVIEGWFARLGEQTIQDWRNQPLAKVNNHEYWAAWAVMATAVVLDRRDFFDWSLETYRTALRQIDRDGYLPNELSRETRALSYHNYSLNPLAMIAAFAKANGVDVQRDAEPLQRLAKRTLEGVDDPKAFETRTGEKQELDDLKDSSKFAWLEAYCWTFACDSRMSSRMEELRPMKTYRMGGDVTALFAGKPQKVASQ